MRKEWIGDNRCKAMDSNSIDEMNSYGGIEMGKPGWGGR